MRARTLCSFVFLSGLVSGLLGPVFTQGASAEGLTEEPFVCAGVHDEGRLDARPLAKLAQEETTQLTALVIFAKFSGEAPEDSLAPAFADDLFDPNLFGSLSHFYHTMSCGQFEITGSVLPKRYTSAHEGSHYVLVDSAGTTGNFGEFNRQILQQADADVGFGEFDNDGPDGIPNSGDDDGVADFVFVNLLSRPEGFFPGSATGTASLGLEEPYVTADSSASGGLIQVRVGATQRVGAFAYTVGVMAHELGHHLGLPDLYGRTLGDEPDPEEHSAGIGKWGLMGQGCTGWHGNDGPVPLCAWSREQLGWIGQANADLVVVESPMTDVDIEALARGGKAYKIPVSRTEYFLVEHRLASAGGYDRDSPASGLLIWHIGAGPANFAEQAKLVDLECADGLYADKGYPEGTMADVVNGRDNLDYWSYDTAYTAAHLGNLGDPTDVFDGVRFAQFGPETNPSSVAADGQDTWIVVENIRRDGDRMIADLLPGPGRVRLLYASVGDSSAPWCTGNGNGLPEPGETVRQIVRLVNQGPSDAYGIEAILHSDDPCVSWMDSSVHYGDLSPLEESERAFVYTVSCEPEAGIVPFALQIMDRDGHEWWEELSGYAGTGISLLYRLCDNTSLEVPDVTLGNGDGAANPGELVGMQPYYAHEGDTSPAPAYVQLRSSSPFIRDLDGSVPFIGELPVAPQGQLTWASQRCLRLFIDPGVPADTTVQLIMLALTSDRVVVAQELIDLDIRGRDATPPFVKHIEVIPCSQPVQIGDQLTVRSSFYGGEKPNSVRLTVVTLPDGEPVREVEMADDGMHGDELADDGLYAGSWTVPFASSFRATIRAEDDTGNQRQVAFRFSCVGGGAPLLLCESLRLGEESAYCNALDSIGVAYEHWNVLDLGTLGLEDVLPLYAAGALIVTPTVHLSEELLARYLEEGAALFLPNVSSRLSDFLQEYFHTEMDWDWTGSWRPELEGVAGDPITEGLSVTLVEWADAEGLIPGYPAVSIFRETQQSCAVRLSTPTYRGVALGFDPMDIAEPQTSHGLLERIIGWLAPSLVVPHQHNVSAECLVSPPGPWPGFPVTLEPTVAVINRGPETETQVSVHFSVRAEEAPLHHEQTLAGPLEGFASAQVEFGSWAPPAPGVYDLVFWVESDGDQYPLDDTLQVRLWCGQSFVPGPMYEWLDEEILSTSWDFQALPTYDRLVSALSGWFGTGSMADLNNDGHLDAYVHGYSECRLMLGKADGTWEDVTERSGLAQYHGRGEDVVFFDADNDGYLDLLCALADSCVLYHNLGDGSFERVTTETGLSAGARQTCVGDLDNDGDLDLALVGSWESERPVMLYCNQGDGTFEDSTEGSGLDALEHDPLFLGLADFNNDGAIDILRGDWPGTSLHLNQGDWTFTELPTGVGSPDEIGPGLSLGDYDNDGDIDLSGTLLALLDDQSWEVRRLFANNGDGTFTDATSLISGGQLQDRVMLGDHDNDGDLDLLNVDLGSRPWTVGRLYLNSGNDNHYLRVALEGTLSNRSGVGARIRVVTGESSGQAKSQTREPGFDRVHQAWSPGPRFQGPVNAHFGLGSHAVADTVEVRWPSAIVDRLLNVPADQLIRIREGDHPSTVGEAAATPLPTAYTLFQNWPNPFNSATTIACDLPEAQDVRLEVHNIIGQHVVTLVSARQEAGRHTVIWDARGLGTGLYFYHLQAGAFVRSRRMVLLK